LHLSAAWPGQAHSPCVRIRCSGPEHAPLNSAPFLTGSGPHLMRSSLNPHELVSQTASRSVQPFLHSSPVFPNTETDIQTTLRAITLAMGHVYSVSGKNSVLYILHTHAQTRPVLHKIKHAHVQMYLGYCYKMVSRMSVTVLAIQQPGPQG